jgi:hypothetical protein
MFSQTADAMTFASRLDGRFQDDAKFANRWRSLNIDDAGQRHLGPPQPYEGNAVYVRLTRLKEPAGAIFVEYHHVFLEPKQWFQGNSPLRSKLPLLLQTEVRAFRRALAKHGS